jgi:hypothetical protein
MKWLVLAVLIVAASPAWSQAVVLSACGSIGTPLKPGTLHNLTMNPTGYLCVTTGSTTALEAPSNQLPELPVKPDGAPKP